jgi:DNA primase
LLTAPGLLRFVDREIAPDSIRHPQLQQLLALMLYHGESQPWNFKTLLGALEDSELKRLAVWLDDQARAKDLAKKLRETGADSDETCPLFLRATIDNLKWREEEQSQLQRGAITSPDSGEGSPPPDDADQLRQAYQFHQRRATKRTTA